MLFTLDVSMEKFKLNEYTFHKLLNKMLAYKNVNIKLADYSCVVSIPEPDITAFFSVVDGKCHLSVILRTSDNEEGHHVNISDNASVSPFTGRWDAYEDSTDFYIFTIK